jgi:tetratricopeptide (TPR) repeat protein
MVSATAQLEGRRFVLSRPSVGSGGSDTTPYQKSADSSWNLMALLRQELDTWYGQLKTEAAETLRLVNAGLAESKKRQDQVEQDVAKLSATTSQSLQEQTRMEQRLRQDINTALSEPRALPPEQLDDVVPILLNELAKYGYTAPQVTASEEPRVAPLVGQPNPQLASKHYALGRLAYFSSDRGQAEDAVNHFSEAARQDPQNVAYRYYLGLALHRAGRAKEAIAQVEAGRTLELQTRQRHVDSDLERVQGEHRSWLERVRWSFVSTAH